MAALLYAESRTDTVRGRSVENATLMDARKRDAETHLAGLFATVVRSRGGELELVDTPADILRGSDTSIYRAVFPAADNAVYAAHALVEGSPGLPTEVRIAIGPGSPDETGTYDFGDCQALCAVALDRQILVRGEVQGDLSAPTLADHPSRPLGDLRPLDLSPPVATFLSQRDGSDPFQAPVGLNAVAHNLPIIRTPFVGRVRERRDLRLFLEAHPLVTIVSGGGVGKTRLALQLAGEVAPSFAHGVFLIDLAMLSNEQLVAETMAAAVGIEETSDQTSIDALVEWVGRRRVLLLVDNCEHVLDACQAAAARLVRECPNVRLLATSRVRLGLPEEHAFELPALSVETDTEHGRCVPSEAVDLFLRRVRGRRDHASLPDPKTFNPAVLDALCRLLEGNPLAIELATARIGRWSIEEVFDRVSERFAALGEDPDATHPRQRSLWATIEWSVRLLSEPTAVLFRRMSVFRGGATAHDILSVVTDEMLPESQIESALNELESGHLIVLDRTEQGSVRFRQLETIRTFGEEALVAAGGVEVFNARHASHFRDMLIAQAPALNGPQQVAVQRAFQEAHGNIRKALDWHVVSGETEHGLRLGVALRRFWATAGYLNEGRHYLSRLLAIDDASVPKPVRANALHCLGTIAKRQSAFDLALTSLNESMELAEATNDLALLGKLRNSLGNIAWAKADMREAKAHFDASLLMLKETEHEVGIVTVLNMLAVTQMFMGDLDEATENLNQSRHLAEDIGNERGVIDALNNLAIIHGIRGEYGKARSMLAQCMNALQHFHDARRAGLSMTNLAHIAFRQGRHEDARQLCHASIREQLQIGDHGGVGLSHVTLGAVALADQDYDEASRQFGACQAILEEYGERSFEADIHLGLGKVAFARGQLEEARRLFEEAMETALAMPHCNIEAQAAYALGRLELSVGRVDEAAAHLRASLRLRVAMSSPRGIAETLESLAEIAFLRGNPKRAVHCLAAAHAMRETIGSPLPGGEQREIDLRIDTVRNQIGPMTFDSAWAVGLKEDGQGVVREELEAIAT